MTWTMNRKLKWYYVKRREHAGGGCYEKFYAVQAYAASEAATIAFNCETETSFSDIVSVSVKHKDITVIPHAEEEKENA